MSTTSKDRPNLLVTATKAILNNWQDAMKISLVCYIAYMLFSTIDSVASEPYRNIYGLGGFEIAVLKLIGFVGTLVASGTIAIAWHRFILRGETRKSYFWFESAAPLLRYFWFGFLAIIPGILAAVCFIILLYLTSSGSDTVLIAGLFVSAGLISFLMLRLGLKLPAIALGDFEYTFATSWRKTSDYSLQIALASLLFAVAFLVVSLIAGLSDLADDQPSLVMETIMVGVFVWPTMMLGLSILTTLYGWTEQN